MESSDDDGDGDDRRSRSYRKRTKRSFFDATPQSMAMMGMNVMATQSEKEYQQFPGGQMAQYDTSAAMPPGMAPPVINPQLLSAAIAMTKTGTPGMMATPGATMMHAGSVGGMPPVGGFREDKNVRRVYVGNIPHGTTDVELLDFFNTTLRQAGVINDPGDFAIGGSMNYERGFMFMEFRSAAEATWGMALDGVRFKGSVLRVRRPNNYVLPPGVEREEIPHIPGIVSTNVADGPNKVFIGGIASVLEDDQVQSMLSQFGELKAFNLVRDTRTGIAKGYAFCEFADPNVTELAIEGLNGIEVAGKKLVVQRASSGAQRQSGGMQDGSGPFGLSMISIDPNDPMRGGIANILNPQMPVQTALNMMQTTIPNLNYTPTRILVLLNMVTEEELENEDEYDWISGAVHMEVSKYGTVKSVIIPQPVKEKPSDVEGQTVEERESIRHKRNIDAGVCKIFVEYASVEDAQRAQNSLQGRRFLGRVVITSFHPEDQYANRKL